MSTSRKGQFFSYDAVIGGVIFVIAFALLASYWWGVSSTLNPEREDLLRDALRISDFLLTEGNPPYWNSLARENVALVGFADSAKNATLSESKLSKFRELSENDYTYAKEHLLRTPYHFNITLERGGLLLTCGGAPCTMGSALAAGSRNQVVVTRVVKYGSGLADLKIILWV
ncbi:MAG: hypothetical protein QXH27_00405 [Candidatus Micrarchaeia archaeon]